MPIHKPDKVLLHKIPLKFVADKVAGGHGKALDASIPLVPFIDFLITLVVFLLTSFSASGELLSQRANLVMPAAANAADLEIAPIIAIDSRVITLDGRVVAQTQDLMNSPNATERMDNLIQDLETLKRNWTVLHPRDKFEEKGNAVIIQSDKGIDYRVLKKVMFSAGQAGYSNINFAVNRKSK